MEFNKKILFILCFSCLLISNTIIFSETIIIVYGPEKNNPKWNKNIKSFHDFFSNKISKINKNNTSKNFELKIVPNTIPVSKANKINFENIFYSQDYNYTETPNYNSLIQCFLDSFETKSKILIISFGSGNRVVIEFLKYLYEILNNSNLDINDFVVKIPQNFDLISDDIEKLFVCNNKQPETKDNLYSSKINLLDYYTEFDSYSLCKIFKNKK